VIFWGTFFPLISEAVTGDQRSVGPPWFDRYTVPLALVLVLLSGIGPLIAWRRATAANFRRNLLGPVGFGLAVGVAMVVWLHRETTAVLMFGLVAFVLAAVGQELWRGVRARRAMSGGSVPVALVALVRRNRRRYGGYLVHAGMAVLFLGIAASSSFRDERDVRLAPGQSARVGGYDVTYVKPTAQLVTAPNGRLERIDLGAQLRLTRGGRMVGTLHTHKSYFPSPAPILGPVSRYFEGDATSEVGLRAGLGRDVWTAISPDTDRLRPVIAQGDKVFSGPGAKLPSAQRDMFLAETLRGLTARYTDNPPPATFRLLVSPMVQWIWIGALIVFMGALIAIWPPPRALARRAAATYAARVGREARSMARV
jgi:cytochrome c-type biogenesis protein CcmF